MTDSVAQPPRSFLPFIVIGVGFVVLAIVCAARAGVGLMMPVWEPESGWSRGYFSAAISGALVVMAILAPLAGRLVDRQGSRSVLVLGLVALAAGCLVIALTHNSWVFFIALAGLSGIGFGLVATHVVSTAVEQQLDRNQGLGIGIATSGSTAGQFTLLPLLAASLSFVSWRWSYIGLAVACLLLAIAVWFLLPGTRPKSIEATAARSSGADLRADLLMVLKKPAFHLLFWSYFICGYTTSGVIEVHFIPYAMLCGFTPVASTSAFGVLSAASMVGMILVGWLTDRMNRPLLLGTIYVLRGAAFVLLVYVGADYGTLVTFAIAFGIVDYSTVPVTASLVASHIGLRVMGLAFGFISAGHQIGAAVGAFMGGVLFDLYAQYVWVWWSSVALALLAGVMCYVIREGRPAAAAASA